MHLVVEPEPVEGIADIVVMMNVLARALQGIAPGTPFPGKKPQSRRPERHIHGRRVERCEKPDEVPLHLDVPARIIVSEVQVGIPQHAEKRTAAPDNEGGDGRPGTAQDLGAVPEHDAERGIAELAQELQQQPALHRERFPLARIGRLRRNRARIGSALDGGWYGANGALSQQCGIQGLGVFALHRCRRTRTEGRVRGHGNAFGRRPKKLKHVFGRWTTLRWQAIHNATLHGVSISMGSYCGACVRSAPRSASRPPRTGRRCRSGSACRWPCARWQALPPGSRSKSRAAAPRRSRS